MTLSYNYPPQLAYPSAPPVYRSFPAPPRLPWGWVLLLSILTVGIFGLVWMVVQANWVRKVTKNAKPFGWCLANALAFPAALLLVVTVVATLAAIHRMDLVVDFDIFFRVFNRLAFFVLYVVAAFTLKGALEAEPIDIPLSGVMTFFFAPTYFQYHLFDYSVDGKTGEQLSGFAEPAAATVTELPPQSGAVES